jgi:serine carboxypeptidase-like clade II
VNRISEQGFMVGNAWTDAAVDNKGAVDFWHAHALITSITHKRVLEHCKFGHVGPYRADGLVRSRCGQPAEVLSQVLSL